MLEWIGLIIKSFFLVPLMIVAALFNGALCFIGVDLACQELDYNLDLLISSAIIAGATLTALFVVAPMVWLFVTKPEASIERTKKMVLFIPNKIFRLYARLHYFLVPHPAEAVIKAGRSGEDARKIDPQAVVNAMRNGGTSKLDPHNAPPAYQSENKRRRAEELKKAAAADRKLLEELEEREWARRCMEKAKRGEK